MMIKRHEKVTSTHVSALNKGMVGKWMSRILEEELINIEKYQ